MNELRGQRVAYASEQHIRSVAAAACVVFGFEPLVKRRKPNYEQAIENLYEYKIVLSVEEDNDWDRATLGSIAGHCNPTTFTISIPEQSYKAACAGDKAALAVLFHEIGHLVLGHQASLHFSVRPKTKNEDSEWQADTFASCALSYLGYGGEQQSFDFE